MSPESNQLSSALRQILIERLHRNPAYSLRAFARDLGVSHSYLSMVLNGKRALPLGRALDIIRRSGMERASASAFLEVALEAPAKGAVPTRALTRRYVSLEADRFKAVAEWYHVALLDLTLVRGFQSDATWISRRLGVPARKIEAAANRLERLGLLDRTAGRWTKTYRDLVVPDAFSGAIRRYHASLIRKGLAQLESTSPQNRERRDITGTTIPLDPTKLPEAKRRIARFRKRLMAFLSDGTCTELYQLNVLLFPLTRELPQKRRRG